MNTIVDIQVRSIVVQIGFNLTLLENIRLAELEEVVPQTRPLACDGRLHTH
jgi:hypothetical protein